MNNNLLPIHFAPLQGYTDAVYRLAHARIFGASTLTIPLLYVWNMVRSVVKTHAI